jgi:hypothetical protein
MPHWRAQDRISLFRRAGILFPSMRKGLDLPRIYADARRDLPAANDGMLPLPTTETRALTLDELLAS